MKTILLYVHLLSLAGAIGSMLIVERLFFFRNRKFSQDSYDTVYFASRTIAVSLLLLWVTGAGLVLVGYLGDPAYIQNQKIWAKVSIVLLMSINGIYIQKALLPRLAALAGGAQFIRTAAESARMRFAFAASLAGWLITPFYGTAKFLNHGFVFGELYGLYLFAVVMTFAFSYLVTDQSVNRLDDGITTAGVR